MESENEYAFGVGTPVWYDDVDGMERGFVSRVLRDHTNCDYKVALDGATVKTSESNLQKRETSEQIRNPFGGVEIIARGKQAGHSRHVWYSIPAQGSGQHLTAEEAREVAEAFRNESDALELILDDDAEEVAQGFEEAADALERMETPPDER